MFKMLRKVGILGLIGLGVYVAGDYYKQQNQPPERPTPAWPRDRTPQQEPINAEGVRPEGEAPPASIPEISPSEIFPDPGPEPLPAPLPDSWLSAAQVDALNTCFAGVARPGADMEKTNETVRESLFRLGRLITQVPVDMTPAQVESMCRTGSRALFAHAAQLTTFQCEIETVRFPDIVNNKGYNVEFCRDGLNMNIVIGPAGVKPKI
jgi:hypothetical protein